jgi:hypothetical protein
LLYAIFSAQYKVGIINFRKNFTTPGGTMSYNVSIEGFEGRNAEIKINYLTGPKLFIDGKPAPKGSKRGEMLLQRNDGKQVNAAWKLRFLGFDYPQLIVNNKLINFVEPLKWYQWGWSALPLAFCIIGGALGAIAGLTAMTINVKVFRTEIYGVLKYALTGVISILAVVAYYITATLLTLLVTG